MITVWIQKLQKFEMEI